MFMNGVTVSGIHTDVIYRQQYEEGVTECI